MDFDAISHSALVFLVSNLRPFVLLNALRELGCVLQSPVLRELGCVLQSPMLRELGCVLQSPVLRELGCVLQSPMLRDLGCVLQSPVLRELGCVLQSPVLPRVGLRPAVSHAPRVGLRPAVSVRGMSIVQKPLELLPNSIAAQQHARCPRTPLLSPPPVLNVHFASGFSPNSIRRTSGSVFSWFATLSPLFPGGTSQDSSLQALA